MKRKVYEKYWAYGSIFIRSLLQHSLSSRKQPQRNLSLAWFKLL